MNVLITGAAGGLGRALAVECAERGFDLMLTDINPAALSAIKEGITRRFHVNVLAEACDLTDKEAVDRLFNRAHERGIEFDMLLNVAGIDFEGGFVERSAEQISSIVKINIEATLDVTHKALEHRAANRRFIIVFVSSLASLYPMPLKACYAASKRFLYDFAYALDHELRPAGVSVMSLCPGGLPTTEEAIKGIAAQGFWGSATSNRLETISRRTIAKALKGRRHYIPGLLNRVLGVLGKLFPRAVVAKVIHARWQNAPAASIRAGI